MTNFIRMILPTQQLPKDDPDPVTNLFWPYDKKLPKGDSGGIIWIILATGQTS
jgi:hypothetical protein